MKLYSVITNSDLTEGKGFAITLALTKLETTAIRLGKGKSVMGSDCQVKPVNLLNHEGKWYAPVDVLPIQIPNKEDEVAQLRLDNMRAAADKAKSLGLSDEDIRMLKGHP